MSDSTPDARLRELIEEFDETANNEEFQEQMSTKDAVEWCAHRLNAVVSHTASGSKRRTEMIDKDDRTFTMTMEVNGEEITHENCRVQPMEDAKKQASEMRKNAPDEVPLTDGKTCDIDDLIEALKEARERGVDSVYVNDDGQTRQFQPRITNNHRHYHATKPRPDELHEWVEL